MPDFTGANIILHGDGLLLMQRKTPGYPFEPYVGRLALVGGGREPDEDVAPRDTLLRELHEELAPPALRQRAAARLEFVAGYALSLPELAPEPATKRASGDDVAPSVHNFFFAADVGDALRDPAVKLREGSLELYELGAGGRELDEVPCWGHDRGLLHWAGAREIAFPHVAPDPTIDAEVIAETEPDRYDDLS